MVGFHGRSAGSSLSLRWLDSLVAVAVALCVLSRPDICPGAESSFTVELAPGISCRVREGEKPGVSVLVVAGSLGAGQDLGLVLKQVSSWPVSMGRLLLLSIDPGAELSFLPERVRASGSREKAVWDFVSRNRPGWIVELDEAELYAGVKKDARGGSLFHDGSAEAARAARLMASGLNAAVEVDDNHFHARKEAGREGALGVLAARELEAKTLSVVGSRNQKVRTKGATHRQLGEFFPVRLATRIRQQRSLVYHLLRELEIIVSSVNVHRLLPEKLRGKAGEKAPLYLAVFDGYGTGTPRPFNELVKDYPFVEVHPVGSPEIQAGGLDDFHVVVFPGGEAMEQWPALGEGGRLAVRRFVRGGGGYIGICAGAYMTAQHPKYRWGLGLLDADILDHDHYARGVGFVKIELTDAGREALGDKRKGLLELHYGNGPLFLRAQKDRVPDYREFAFYRTGIARGGARVETMVDTPAIIGGSYGKGRVVASSGHTGWSKGLEHFFSRYVLWASGRESQARPLANEKGR